MSLYQKHKKNDVHYYEQIWIVGVSLGRSGEVEEIEVWGWWREDEITKGSSKWIPQEDVGGTGDCIVLEEWNGNIVSWKTTSLVVKHLWVYKSYTL